MPAVPIPAEVVEEEIKRLGQRPTRQEAIQTARDMVNVLGPGLCPNCGCEGCKYEVGEVLAQLTILCARYDGKACDRCNGHQYVPRAPDSEFSEDLCPECHGTGIQVGYQASPHIPSRRPE